MRISRSRLGSTKAFAGLVILGLAVVALPRLAALGASDTATATVDLVQAVTFAQVAPLRFGRVKGSSVDGTVTVSTLGARSATGGAKLGGRDKDVGAAQFTVQGAPGSSYGVASTTSPTATKQGPASSDIAVLDVTILTARSTAGGGEAGIGSFTGQLGGGGADTLLIGGTLVVPANAPGGIYEAEVSLSVDSP